MLHFILNDQSIETDLAPGSTVLDFVRYNKRLTGTKIGCREGDCGACMVLVGEIENDKLLYRSMTSCLMTLVNARGKHIVTVEGINGPALTTVQQAMTDTNGTQCGFCTVGFVMSLTGFVLEATANKYEEAIASIDGNICRCTGYKSIQRAAEILAVKMATKPQKGQMQWLVDHNFIPDYFLGIKERLLELRKINSTHSISAEEDMVVGGGTDLVVQHPLAVKRSLINPVFDAEVMKGIRVVQDKCFIGASVTVSDFADSKWTRSIFPDLKKYIKLISSTPIRNMATLAGNLVNASPIGDMSVFFLALNAIIVLINGNKRREIKLNDFYKAYKKTDLAPGELIETIYFTIPDKNDLFGFEKVCKRTHLDIASVNFACHVQFNEDHTIKFAHLAAGGVAPYPKYLAGTGAFLQNKKLSAETLSEAVSVIRSEIAPISDARGSKEYKEILCGQLFLAHFSTPEELIRQTLSLVHQ